MIVYDLSCDSGHRFEGWFGSSDEFECQRDEGLVTCPQCGSDEVQKAPMAPAVPRKGNRGPALVEVPPATEGRQAMTRGPLPAEVADALRHLAEAQARALQNSRWVGDTFAEQSRAMHYGEQEVETIHGQTTPEEAAELFDEGVPISPLPFPIAPPEELN